MKSFILFAFFPFLVEAKLLERTLDIVEHGPAFTQIDSKLQEADGYSDTKGCQFHAQCIWQTCYFGSDSCYWTVTCPAEDENCDDMIHNANFHGPDGTPIHCDPCFNTQCNNDNYNCQSDWDNCDHGDLMEHHMEVCSNDADLGNDCGVAMCDDPATFPADHWHGNQGHSPGTFDCLMDHDHLGYVLAGNVCFFTCGDGGNGGGVVCKDDGSYQDMTSC